MDTQKIILSQIPLSDLVAEIASEVTGRIYRDLNLSNTLLNHQAPRETTKYVDINGASKILSKSPNAIRVQLSLGNIKCFKKGSRNYFEVEYLEKWLLGDLKNEG